MNEGGAEEQLRPAEVSPQTLMQRSQASEEVSHFTLVIGFDNLQGPAVH